MYKLFITFLLIFLGFNANAGYYAQHDDIAINPAFAAPIFEGEPVFEVDSNLPTEIIIVITCDDGSTTEVPIQFGEPFNLNQLEEMYCHF